MIKKNITGLVKRLQSSMEVNMIGAIILLLIIFGSIAIWLGYVSFSTSFRKEYEVTTYHIADTATTLIKGDYVDDYLAGGKRASYVVTKNALDAYCKTMSVVTMYLIKVDTSDYGRFVSVFNPVNNEVDNTSYVEWELGHKRDTTNEEYARKYRRLYEKESQYETIYRENPGDGAHPHITTMVPVMDSSEDVVAILCLQRPMSELKKAVLSFMRNIVFSIFLLGAITSAFAVLYVRKHFVRPVRAVSREATRFARENTIGEPLSQISRFEELSTLAGSIDTMEADMVQYIQNLTTITAERERIGAELALGRSIQENSLPNDFPAFPDRTDFDIYATMTPAKEVGGDFYNFFLLDEDHLVLIIGDVSGKGVPAALFMMVTNILITDRTKMGGTPAEILTFVNNALYEHNEAEMFVTLWLGILDLTTGRLTAVNAGHENPALCRKDGSFEAVVSKHCFVAGVMPDVSYRNVELQMEPGDKLFLYTDGVTEATDAHERLFAQERMLEALNEYKDESPENILRGVHQTINDFVGEASQFDDLTMLCVELKGMG